MIKNTKLLLYICIAIFLFYSCTEEKEYLENNNRDFKIETKSFKELERNPLFNKTFNKFKMNKQKSNASRSALEDEYNFTIDPSRIKVLTYDDKVSYNFLISKDNPEAGKFENLVIEVRNSDDMKAYLMKYSKATNTLISVNGKPDVTLLDVKNESTEARVLQYCFTVYTKYCNKTGTCDGVTFTGQHLANTSCCDDPDFFVYVPGKDCVTITIPSFADFPISISDWAYLGENNNSNNENTTSDPENINGATSTEEVGAVPVTEEEEANEEPINTESPCDQLKNLIKQDTIVPNNEPEDEGWDTISRPNLQTKLIDIRTKVLLPNEHGHELKFTKLSAVNQVYSDNYKISTGPNLEIELDVNGDIYGGIHSHPLGGNEIPSFGDLVWLRDCYDQARDYNKDKAISIVVVKNPVAGALPTTLTYALKIDNIIKFKQKINQILNSHPTVATEEKKIKAELKDEGTYYKSTQPEKFEKLFLEKYKDFGLSIYRADNNLMNWNKLSLSSGFPVTVIATPCSN